MTTDLITADRATTAMIIIEEMIDSVLSEAGQPWQDFRDNNGIAATRAFVLDVLSPAADAAWEKAYAAYEHEEATAQVEGREAKFADPGAFDYDFVPSWLRVAVDWSDVNSPRVRGSKS